MLTQDQKLLVPVDLEAALTQLRAYRARIYQDYQKPVNLVLDSRKVQEHDIFVVRVDSSAYIDAAVANGAGFLLTDDAQLSQKHGILKVSDFAALAREFYELNIEKLNLFGVTGTNGKTTCTSFCAQLSNLLNEKSGIIGTLGAGTLNNLVSTGYTTPDIFNLYRHLAILQQDNVNNIALEVSSHGLAQHRVDGLKFNTVAFTNLTRDHLDYHHDMDDYAAAKYKLFENPHPGQSQIFNLDDEVGLRWFEQCCSGRPLCRPYGITLQPENKLKSKNIIQITELHINISGQWQGKVSTPWGDGEFVLNMLGRYNVFNALVAATWGWIQGWDFDLVLHSLAKLKAAAGRVQTIYNANGPTIVVDYAHTPDALQRSLQAVRESCPADSGSKLWVVFGCGGNRDMGKRGMMGQIANIYADHIVLTEDNSRQENPLDIMQQISIGVTKTEHLSLIEDRRAAIQYAIDHAKPIDWILIAGKGHENHLERKDGKIEFCDYTVAQELCKTY